MAFGQTKTDLHEQCVRIGGQREWIHRIHKDFGETLDVLIAQIEASGISPKISAVVRLPEVEFKARQAELVHNIRHNLEQVKALAEEQGSFKVAKMRGGFDRELKPMA